MSRRRLVAALVDLQLWLSLALVSLAGVVLIPALLRTDIDPVPWELIGLGNLPTALFALAARRQVRADPPRWKRVVGLEVAAGALVALAAIQVWLFALTTVVSETFSLALGAALAGAGISYAIVGLACFPPTPIGEAAVAAVAVGVLLAPFVIELGFRDADLFSQCPPGGPAADFTVSGQLRSHVTSVCNTPSFSSELGRGECETIGSPTHAERATADVLFLIWPEAYSIEVDAIPDAHDLLGFPLKAEVSNVSTGAPPTQGQAWATAVLHGRGITDWSGSARGNVVFNYDGTGTMDLRVASSYGRAAAPVSIRGRWACPNPVHAYPR